MKSLVNYINESLLKESVSKDMDDMYSCGTIDNKAATFSKNDIIECLKKIKEYRKLDDIQVTAWDPKSPRTVAYKYEGVKDNALVFMSADDEYVNKNLYDTIMKDLESMDDVIVVKFDKCKYVQLLSVYQNDFYQKDAYIMSFEG